MARDLISAPAHELREAFAALDRGEPPWCTAPDARFLRSAIVDRTEWLGTGFWQLVRLVRIAALASPRRYFEFFYRLPALRAVHFQEALLAARKVGALPRDSVELGPGVVRLLEPALASGNAEAFKLTLAQMPRLAALLDVLHNTLGYADVAKLLAPITTAGQPPAGADAVARALRGAFSEWLKPRLESTHRRQQAKLMHAFLASRYAVHPNKFDDAVMFDFWRSRALTWHRALHAAVSRGAEQEVRTVEKAALDEGFRQYRSAVTLLLRYRRALEDARAEQAMTANALDVDVDRYELAGGAESSSWENPLAELLAPPANRVKWLTDKERGQLGNFLGATAAAAEKSSAGEDDGEEVDGGALMEGQPYDLRLTRTLLRVDVFGPAQSRISAQLKKAAAPDKALAAALLPIDDMAYEGARDSYRLVAEQIEKEARAALHVLGSAGAVEGTFLLVKHLAGDDTAADLRAALGLDEGETDLSAEDAMALGQRLAALVDAGGAAASGDLARLLGEAKATYKGVNRQGFRKQDAHDPRIAQALEAGIAPLGRLTRLIGQLVRRLEAGALTPAARADREAFAEVLGLIYLPPAAQPRPAD